MDLNRCFDVNLTAASSSINASFLLKGSALTDPEYSILIKKFINSLILITPVDAGSSLS